VERRPNPAGLQEDQRARWSVEASDNEISQDPTGHPSKRRPHLLAVLLPCGAGGRRSPCSTRSRKHAKCTVPLRRGGGGDAELPLALVSVNEGTDARLPVQASKGGDQESRQQRPAWGSWRRGCGRSPSAPSSPASPSAGGRRRPLSSPPPPPPRPSTARGAARKASRSSPPSPTPSSPAARGTRIRSWRIYSATGWDRRLILATHRLITQGYARTIFVILIGVATTIPQDRTRTTPKCRRLLLSPNLNWY
jgi:hypothetical protein